jgi:Zn-dependent protease with chaperone function
MTAPLAALYAAGLEESTRAAYHGFAAWRPAGSELAILVAAALGLGVYARWVFGAFSKLLELEADLVGCRNPGHTQSAYAALYKLGHVYGFDRPSWLHPTIRLRLRVLRAAGRRAAFRERVLVGIRWWKRAMLITLAGALLGCV